MPRSPKALIGLLIVLAAITLYIAIRFELKMAICAIVALIHDVTITVGVYALSGREVTLETVIAVLTILGFSLYDTVATYDKIKENLETQSLVARPRRRRRDRPVAEPGADAVGEHVARRAPADPVAAAVRRRDLKDFAFAMFIGTAIGVYSSIFLAAPLFSVLKAREVRFKQLEQKRTERERVVARRAGATTATPGTATGEAAAARATARTGTVAQPRPGQRSKRRSRRPSASGGDPWRSSRSSAADPGRTRLPGARHRLQGHHAGPRAPRCDVDDHRS